MNEIINKENEQLWNEIIYNLKEYNYDNFNTQKNGVIKLMENILDKNVLLHIPTNELRNKLTPVKTYVSILKLMKEEKDNISYLNQLAFKGIFDDLYFKTLRLMNYYLYEFKLPLI